MSDLISRQAVLDKFKSLCDVCGDGEKYNGVMCRCCSLDDGICIVEDMPSAEPLEDFEWCHDCKEYDQEKHCCHRWTKVIRKTVEEMQMMGKIAKVIEHDASITDTDGYKYLRSEYICGNCKKKVIGGDEYCSHCGARLEWNHE